MNLRGDGSEAGARRGGGFAKRSRQMQWVETRGSAGPAASWRFAMRALPLVLALTHGAPPVLSAAPAPAADSAAASRTRASAVGSFAPAFTHLPLAAPLALNGGFGEYRSNHFHAGLDLGTGGAVGHPVLAPAPGWIERVRASGAGYGRSLYLHTEDGRLLVFGHLDAYVEPIASYVAAAQESTGQYEVDLWPEAGRFRFEAGQRIAWNGESGAGGPHLHVEVRRGDMAYHPLRAGIAIPDSSAPTLAAVTFEPLDDTSYVERSAAPVTVPLDRGEATVTALGRMRVIVAARDGVWRGVDRMVPWSVALGFDRLQVECRFDSVSWATDMSESDYVYDTGGVTGERGMMMWAPGGFRPRVMRTNVPQDQDAGTLIVRPGDPPRTLRLVASDLGGNRCVRSVVLRPPAPGQGRPDAAAAGGRALGDSSRWFELSSLPGERLRVTFRGAPVGSRGVAIGGRAASLRDGDWTAVLALPPARDDAPPIIIPVTGLDARGKAWVRSSPAMRRLNPGGGRTAPGPGAISWDVPRAAMFVAGPVLFRWSMAPPAAPRELAARSEVLELEPSSLRLRRPMRLEWGAAAGTGASLGLYGDDGEGWTWIGSPPDSASGRRVGETRHFGRFALFADTLAPRLAPLRPRRRPPGGPYSRWALEVRVREEGSGVDARAVWVEVDGRRHPVEWDGEKEVLRWRPLEPPA